MTGRTRRSLALALGGALCASVLAVGGVAAGRPGTTERVEPRVPAATRAGPVVLPAASRTTTAARTTARWSGALDTTDRAAVLAEYRSRFAPGLTLGTGWTGSEAGCRRGTTSTASRAATLRALNYARSLAGLAPVSFSPDLDARSQLTALIMSANGSLSHTPPPTWRCWTATGAANAARSNLALATPRLTSSGLVSLYLEDPGASNQAAGHRRWLLNPFATVMGSGSTTTANAITVMGPQSLSRPNPTWVSWPTAGWFPDALEPSGRWSLSAGSSTTSFRHASVRVWRNGTALRTVKHPVQDGFARPTLVWQQPATLSRSGTFRVVVSGIRRVGSPTALTRSYVVRLADASA